MQAELPKAAALAERIFTISSADAFNELALDTFRFQHSTNPVYRSYCDALHVNPFQIRHVHQIPALPISFFKTHNVQCGLDSIPEVVFESSGTTGMRPSRHLVLNMGLYQSSFRQTFATFYGNPQQYCIIGLLPSYLQRQHSSLVFMVADLIQQSNHPKSGFYLENLEDLAETLAEIESKAQKAILFGVTYALLDFAERYPMALRNTILIETGGMKGRKKELLREEVHEVLKKSFQLRSIHSEYGMTELLSQAYAVENGFFKAPPWMRVLIREEDDPFSYTTKTGGITVIDLANLYSCAFIATEDVGRLHTDDSFEVLGRLDNAEIRGCSLLTL